MSREYVNTDREKYDRLKQRAEKKGGLVAALWTYAANSYSADAFSNLWRELERIYGKFPNALKTPEEFWHPELKKTIVDLAGTDFQKDMEEIVRMILEGQFSSTMWRRSYRSGEFGYYAVRVLSEIGGCLYLSTFHQSVKELLYCQHDWLRGYEVHLALEIRRGNREIVSIIREAILGDNQAVFLTTKIIRAILISGNEELIDLVVKLLVAADRKSVV